jgi:site-specific recombinase XerD
MCLGAMLGSWISHSITSSMTVLLRKRSMFLLTRGPLSPHLTEYAQYLHDAGYAIQSGQLQLRMLGDFSTWLDKKHLGADEVNWSTVERYIRCRRKAGRLRNEDAAALARMLRMLRAGQAEAPAPPATAQQIALEQFQHYLRQVRGLAEGTVTKYTPIVRAFLAENFSVGIPDFHQISAGDIARFIQHQAERITSRDAPTVVTALRSFLRHLLHYGAVDTDLAACVPTIATWSLSNVPKFLPAEQIQRVLDSCDRDTASGKRNYCILLLLARLGLRAGEVVALTLDDIDWEEGVITVRGKGKRVAQMPLPAEVGAALAVYLRRASAGLFESARLYSGEGAVGGFCQLRGDLLAGRPSTDESWSRVRLSRIAPVQAQSGHYAAQTRGVFGERPEVR